MRPNLVNINPRTNQPYTPTELVEMELNSINQRYAETPYGGTVVRSPQVSVSDKDNTYFDYLHTGYQIGADNEEMRAQLQPWTEQLGRSATKFIGIGVSTFAQGTIGVLAGLVNLATGKEDQGLYNRFIDNPFSKEMVDFQQRLEEALPNYRTQEEMDNPFWINAIKNPTNFWGETILKNLGFAVGAMGAGMVTGGIGAELFGLTKLRNTSKVLEGLSKALQEGRTLTAAEQAAMKQMATLTGEQLATLKNTQVLDELATVAKAIKSKTAMNQVVSSFVGSLGESTFEALQNGKDFKEQRMQGLRAQIESGEITPEEYEQELNNLEKETQNYQNSVFTANVGLLTLSNYTQFRNIFSKGYTPNKVLTTEAINVAEDTGLYELVKRNKFQKGLDYTAKLLKDPLMEMTEEQGQFAIQKTAESYYNLRLDKDANSDVQNFITSIGRGLQEAYGTEEGWENAFAGLVIGGLGIPTIKRAPGSKLGVKLGIEGGIYGEYKELSAADASFKRNVEAANSYLQDTLTKKLYEGQVVDNALKSMADEALLADDRMNHKTINSMQLANMVDTFVEIGKFEDLKTKIQDENLLSAAELRAKYSSKVVSSVTGKETTLDFFKGMDDDQVKQYIKDKGEKALKQAEKIKKIKEDIDVRFSDYPEGARKDMLLKAAATLDIDDRINSLLGEIKAETGTQFLRGLNENFTPEMIQYISDFSALATPVDLEQFLSKKKGLDNYRRLVNEYLEYQSNPETKLKFAEKARDLYGLILQRQAMNDAYFKMADKRYAENAQALAETDAQERFLDKTSKEERYKNFYQANTNEDPEFGFESTVFKVDNGKKDKLTVTGISKSTGAPITLQDAQPVTENPNLIDEDGNAAVRTSKAGDKYATYKVIVDGKEVKVEVKNPVESRETIDDTIDLFFKRGQPNVMYDKDGNVYNLEDLEKDPSFLASSSFSREEQRQEIYNNVRVQTLQKQIKANMALAENLRAQKEIIEESIAEAEELLKRAKATKSGRIRVTIDGIKTTFKIFDLENKLAQYRAKIAELDEQRATLFEENNKALAGLKEVQENRFRRDVFNKAITEDIAALQKQIRDVQDAKNQAEATAERMQEVIDALKALVKVIYPRFKALYKSIYGVDPATVNNLMVKWQTDVTPLLRQLRAEQTQAFLNLGIEEKQLDAVLEQLAEIQSYINSWEKMINSLNKERSLFEDALAKVLAERRAKQAESAPRQAAKRTYTQEIDNSQDTLITNYSSPRPSIDNAFKTAGMDTLPDGTPNPNKAQQRWSKTVAKIKLSNAKFSLRVVTAQQRPDLFVDAEGKPLPEKMQENALAVILYKNGAPVDANLQPLGENAGEDQLVYNFIPLPTLQTENYERFYDAKDRPIEAAQAMEKLQALRDKLFERAAAGINSFLPVTGKSLGLLETTPHKRTGDRDLTTAVWDTLLGNTENKKGERLGKSRIEIAKATNDEDAAEGWGYITVGKEQVKVKNGLAYFITDEDVVVPLLSRKLSSNETQVVFDLLTALTSSAEIALAPEEAEAVKKATATKKKKSEFVSLGKDKEQAQKKIGAINKKSKGFKFKLFWNKAKQSWGYYKRKQLTKEEAEAARKSKTQDTLSIYDYLRGIVYFGRQDKAEDALLSARPNPQTQLYLTEGQLSFYDFSKGTRVEIPFTQESLEANKDALLTFLENKYHQISNDKLGKSGSHLEVNRVVFDEEGKPLYVETTKHNSYFSYLISNKQPNGNPRPVEDIPLTTNAVTDSNGEIIIKSTYLKYSDNPEAIKETPESSKATYTPPKAGTTTPPPSAKSSAASLLEEVKGIINKGEAQFTDANYPTDEEGNILSTELANIFKKVESILGEKAFDEFVDTELVESLEDDELASKIKAAGQSIGFEAYDTYRKIATKLESLVASAPTAPAEGGEFAAGESSELAALMGSSETVVTDNVESGEEADISEGEIEEDPIITEEENEDLDGLARTQQTGGPKIDLAKAKTWIAKNLPQVKIETAEKLLNGIAQGKVTGDAVLYLSELAEEGTEYHEALHEVMLGLLTDEELAEVYEEAVRLYGKPTEQDLAKLKKTYPKLNKAQLTTVFYDEMLAEDFRTFALSGGKTYPTKKLKTIFEIIWDAIKIIFKVKPSGAIDSMFYNLYNGKYVSRTYDRVKAKERILAPSRFSLITWSTLKKDGTTRPIDKVTATLFTKEVTHSVVGNMFKSLFNANNSIGDLAKMTVGELETFIDDGIRRTKQEIDKLPDDTLYKTPTGVIINTKKTFNAIYTSEAGRKKIRNAVKEYIQNDLAIDLGLYKEDDINEQERTDRDSNAWGKDSSTIHPREGTNAFVKLMVASLPAYSRVDGVMTPEKGDMLGLQMLVNPNSVFNHLLSSLHTSTTFNDPGDNNSMVKVLERLSEEIPHYKTLLALLTDPANMAKDPLEANNLITNFQQSMYKTALNYNLWLVNEGDVVKQDPNAETAEDRTVATWRSKLVENIGSTESIIKKPKDASLPRVDHRKVREILKTIKIPRTDAFKYYMEALNKLGFTIDVTDPFEYNKEEAEEFTKNAEYFIAQLSKEPKSGQDLDLDYIFNKASKSRLFNLAKIAASKLYEVTDLQHIGPDGKTRYGVSEHNAISMLAEYINSMPVGTPIHKLYGRFGKFPGLLSPYISNSKLLNEILFRKNENGRYVRTDVPFKITIIEGARPNQTAAEGKVNTQSDKQDRTWMSFNSILKGIFPILRTSDKSLEYAIDITREGEGNPLFRPGNINSKRSEVVETLVGYLADELLVGKETSGSLIANFGKNKGNGLYFFEEIIKDKVPAILPTQSVEDYVTTNIKAIREAISDYLELHNKEVIQRLVDNNLAVYTPTASGMAVTLRALDKGITEQFEKETGTTFSKSEQGVKMSVAQFDNLIEAFTANSLIGNIEQTKLFFGHPAFYKSAVDLYKRTAGAVGTKKMAIVDTRINNFINSLPQSDKDGKLVKDGFFEVVVMQEPVTMSSYLSDIRKAFEKKFGVKKGSLLASKYSSMEEADGQGYITLPEYREFRLRVGEWGRVEESLYQQVMRGNNIPVDKITKVFNVLKAQYFGLNKIDGLSVPVYLKFSLLPLIPSVYKGTNMEAIAESMMANGQGVAVYPSGIKIGALMQPDGNYYPLYDDIVEEGQYEGNPVAANANTLTLDYRFMGIQVATNNEIKEYTTRGSQNAKLLVSDRYENGVAQPITVYRDGKPKSLTSKETQALVKEYHQTVNQITEEKAKKILAEIGAKEVKPGVYKITNVKNLSNKLIRAARNRNSPDNLINSLGTVEEGTEIRFKYLLDGVPNRNKIENLLFSLINNTVITQKYNGGARIQAASTGFERGPRTYNFKDGKAVLTSNPDLRFYIPGKNGEILPAQVKVAPNSDMLQIIKKLGGIAKTNEILKKLWEVTIEDGKVTGGTRYNPEAVKELLGDISPEIFQFVAYRIPTQGMNTIENLEIVEFLDPLAGEAIHLPSELVAKSGGDFDIDKLNVYFRHFTKEGSLNVEDKEQALHNKMVSISQDFLAAPENYTDLLMPNDPVVLKDLAGKEAPVSKTKSLTWGHNLDTAEYYLVGKAAVGIVARHRTHHTLTQQAGVTINKVYMGGANFDEQTSAKLNFAGSEDNYSLGGISDSNKQHKIGDIISEFLSAFVDVAKDPFIFRLNGNINTADTYMYLIRRGVPIEVASKFMTQPVIIEYFKRYAGGRSMVNVMNGTDVSSGEIKQELYSLLEAAFKNLGGTDASKIAFKSFTEDNLSGYVGKDLSENLKDISFVRTQIQVLDDFSRYMEQSNNLRMLMDATSDDTVRHKNFNALDNYNKRMDEVRKSNMFDSKSVQRIFDDTLVGGFQKAQMLHDVYRDLFVTESPKIKTALDSLRDYLKSNKVDEQSSNDILDRAKNALIVYMFSASKDFMADVQKRLQLGTEDLKSVPEEIASKLKSPNPAIRKNPFYKQLIPLLQNPKSDVKALKMFNVKLTTFDFNQIVNGFSGITDVNEQKRLAALILFQSGLDNSAETWYDKVPVDVMADLLNNAIMQFKDNLTNFDADHFMQEFIRNNYMNSSLVPYLGSLERLTIDKTGTFKGQMPKRFGNRLYLKVKATYPEYQDKDKAALAKAAGLDTAEYLLLAKTEDGSFKLINKRGDRLSKEYKKANMNSMLNKNNVNTGQFRDNFPQWSEPLLPALPKNKSLPSQGETLENNC